ncbi:tryptophan-tRNA ligase [Batrachochytrium salamandrivorans]|nr:tryptophan-tRNA ligase [Batrachochytrium salamandrivorans]
MLRKTIFSGIQPTGVPHLGNYFGALKQWSNMSQSPELADSLRMFCLVDLHAITVPRKPEELKRDTFDCACTLLACGVVPSPKVPIFVQSHIPQHLELFWILQSISKIGSLKRMTQFKEKSAKQNSEQDDSGLGLLAYPVLMAADILLYRASQVPVGDDQLQHIELTRELAESFNYSFGSKTFGKPQAVVPLETKRIMSLCEPTKKMSKSEEKVDSRIILSDSADLIRRKIKRATTDGLGPLVSWEEVRDHRRGVFNLIQLLAASQNQSCEEAFHQHCVGNNMAQLKSRVSEAVVAVVDPIRNDLVRLQTSDRSHVEQVLKQGRELALEEAEATMKLVRQAVGFLTY